MSKHGRGGISTARGRARRIIRALDRSGWACVYCGRPLMLSAVLGPDAGWWKQRQHQSRDGLIVATVDHVVPLAVGGPKNVDKNVVAACQKCNGRRPENPVAIEHVNGVTTRIRYGDREFVREGRSWVEVP